MFAIFTDSERRYVRQPQREPGTNARRFQGMSGHLMRDVGLEHSQACWHAEGGQIGGARGD